MQASTIQDSPAQSENYGILMPPKTYSERFGAPPTGAPTTPVLTANFDIERIDAAMAVKRASFGVYCIPGPDVDIVAIRQQLGPVQNYWLAASCDPGVWWAIQAWRASEWIHVAFFERGDIYSGRDGVRCCVHRSHRGENQIDKYRREGAGDNSAKFLDFARRLIATGSIERTTTSDLDGIALTDVQVNILTTKRIFRYISGLHGEPETARPGTVGSLILA